jgi:hypothetical protein
MIFICFQDMFGAELAIRLPTQLKLLILLAITTGLLTHDTAHILS